MYSPMLNKKNKTDAITKAGEVLKISWSIIRFVCACTCVSGGGGYHHEARIFDKLCELGHSFGCMNFLLAWKGWIQTGPSMKHWNLERGEGSWTKGSWGNGLDEAREYWEENLFLNMSLWQPYPSICVPFFLFVLLFLALSKAETSILWEEKEPAPVSCSFNASAKVFLTQKDARALFTPTHCFQKACAIF